MLELLKRSYDNIAARCQLPNMPVDMMIQSMSMFGGTAVCWRINQHLQVLRTHSEAHILRIDTMERGELKGGPVAGPNEMKQAGNEFFKAGDTPNACMCWRMALHHLQQPPPDCFGPRYKQVDSAMRSRLFRLLSALSHASRSVRLHPYIASSRACDVLPVCPFLLLMGPSARVSSHGLLSPNQATTLCLLQGGGV